MPAKVVARALTVVSWNVEDLRPLLAGDGPPLARVVEALGAPAIVCAQEIRIRPRDAALVDAMARALPGYRCHFSLCDDPRNVAWRGGRAYGVATWLHRALGPTRARTFAWDREGRVVVSELPRLGLVVGNVYAVNGTSKPYFDHERGRVVGDRHAWKRRFIVRLGDELAPDHARGAGLVLVGDWNVSRTRLDTWPRLRTEAPHARARREFNEELLPRLDLVDAFRALHPDARKYTWFNRRAPKGTLDAARVDFALVSSSLMPRVQAADILEDARGMSDHAPLFVTLASGKFGGRKRG